MQPSVSADYMIQEYEYTFGANVTVQFGDIKKTQYGQYKSAKINVAYTTQFEHFKRQIQQYGNATFFHHAKESWIVKMNGIDTVNIEKVKAKIIKKTIRGEPHVFLFYFLFVFFLIPF